MNFREKELTKKTGLILDRKTIIASVGEKMAMTSKRNWDEGDQGEQDERRLEEKDHT